MCTLTYMSAYENSFVNELVLSPNLAFIFTSETSLRVIQKQPLTGVRLLAETRIELCVSQIMICSN